MLDQAHKLGAAKLIEQSAKFVLVLFGEVRAHRFGFGEQAEDVLGYRPMTALDERFENPFKNLDQLAEKIRRSLGGEDGGQDVEDV